MRKLSRPSWRPLTCVIAALTAAMLASPLASAASPRPARAAAVQPTREGGASPSGATCQNFYVPVKESPAALQTYKVWAQLCSRGAVSGKPVQLLVPGGGYTHVYWDWPSRPDYYSYVNAATRAGYATLNLDKLGYGLSDHPNPVPLDFPTGAYVVHQVVQDLRDGSFGARFADVVTNGHSMGGLTIEYEASIYHDVDGLIVSGFGHDLDVTAPDDPFVANTIPASLDPTFAGEPWAPGYYTTKPGSRCLVFSYPGDVDATNCAVEEQTKGTLTQGELDTIVQDSYDPQMTRQITVPVLWVLGRNDNLWCPENHDCTTAPVTSREPDFWQAGLLTQYIAPKAGHSINVDFGAPLFYARSLVWLRQHHL